MRYDEGKVAFGLSGSPNGEIRFLRSLRQPDSLPRLNRAFNGGTSSKRLTALRPCFATGLPCRAIVTF